MIYIMPYKLGSQSAKKLAKSLGVLRIEGKKKLRKEAVVINWGNKTANPISRRGKVNVINKRESVINAANKLSTFSILTKAGLTTVPWTVDKTYAITWLAQGNVVMARSLVSSSQGKGINIIQPNDPSLPQCPLYTKYIPKCHEYRVHVIFGNVVDVTKKKRREGGTQNEYIRNFNNGWVFCREDIDIPDKIKLTCIDAVNVLGLDFGAVDILYKQMTDTCYILEVNTAPGLEGTSLEKYINTFKEVVYAY